MQKLKTQILIIEKFNKINNNKINEYINNTFILLISLLKINNNFIKTHTFNKFN